MSYEGELSSMATDETREQRRAAEIERIVGEAVAEAARFGHLLDDHYVEGLREHLREDFASRDRDEMLAEVSDRLVTEAARELVNLSHSAECQCGTNPKMVRAVLACLIEIKGAKTLAIFSTGDTDAYEAQALLASSARQAEGVFAERSGWRVFTGRLPEEG
jgi:hypothetical protein